MSLNDQFFNVYPYLCLILINAPILAMALPHRIFDTSLPSLNALGVVLIIAGAIGIRGTPFCMNLSILLAISSVAMYFVHKLLQSPAPQKQVMSSTDQLQAQELLKQIK
jgi:hypothetical protein